MKTLYLIRHASYDKKDTTVFDEELKLTTSGYEEIDSIAYQLQAEKIKPELILSSCAIRAQDTALELSSKLGYAGKVHYLDDLYLSSSNAIKETLTLHPYDCDNLFIIGHDEPLRVLIGSISDEKLSEIPNACVIALTLDIDNWYELDSAKGNIDFFLYPEQYDEAIAS